MKPKDAGKHPAKDRIVPNTTEEHPLPKVRSAKAGNRLAQTYLIASETGESGQKRWAQGYADGGWRSWEGGSLQSFSLTTMMPLEPGGLLSNSALR